jgi:phosphoenolpyruvate synthase/pyruvate phosphate dikinase
MHLVYGFDEQAPGGRELLGGKGVGLAEMTALGIPVPAGFTVTTDACRETMRTGEPPEALWPEMDEHVGRLQERTGKRFGDPDRDGNCAGAAIGDGRRHERGISTARRISAPCVGSEDAIRLRVR